MNIAISKQNLASFPTLDKLGVKNAFTYDNATWGNMSLASNPKASESYQQIHAELDLKNRAQVHMQVDHNDNCQLLTPANLRIYKQFNLMPDTNIISIKADSFITKEQVALSASPADCMIIVMTAVDTKDGKRFLVFNHSGIFGAFLKSALSAIRQAHMYYDFADRDLEVFIYPYISGKHFVKSLAGNPMAAEFAEARWQPFVTPMQNSTIGIDWGKLLVAELRAAGIVKIYETGLDTYEQHKAGKLYSHTYAKENVSNEDFRFGVIVSL